MQKKFGKRITLLSCLGRKSNHVMQKYAKTRNTMYAVFVTLHSISKNMCCQERMDASLRDCLKAKIVRVRLLFNCYPEYFCYNSCFVRISLDLVELVFVHIYVHVCECVCVFVRVCSLSSRPKNYVMSLNFSLRI